MFPRGAFRVMMELELLSASAAVGLEVLLVVVLDASLPTAPRTLLAALAAAEVEAAAPSEATMLQSCRSSTAAARINAPRMLIATRHNRNRPTQTDEKLPDVLECEEEEPPRPAAAQAPSFPKSNAMLLAVAALLLVAVVPRRSVRDLLFILYRQ